MPGRRLGNWGQAGAVCYCALQFNTPKNLSFTVFLSSSLVAAVRFRYGMPSMRIIGIIGS